MKYNILPIWIACLILQLCFPPINAQNITTFDHLSVNDGLSQSTIFAINQDSKGFMWFGTRGGGLNKYDGYEFTAYRNIPDMPSSLSDNTVNSPLEKHDLIFLETSKNLNSR